MALVGERVLTDRDDRLESYMSMQHTDMQHTDMQHTDMQHTDSGLIVALNCNLGTIWSANIEFNDLSTLDLVHDAIQSAVGFDDDHLYEFFVARTERSQPKVRYECDDNSLIVTRIRDVFPLAPKHNLYYLFDYGDSWIFRISRSRKKPQTPIAGTDYPRVVSESGEKPMQYEHFDSDDR